MRITRIVLLVGAVAGVCLLASVPAGAEDKVAAAGVELTVVPGHDGPDGLKPFSAAPADRYAVVTIHNRLDRAKKYLFRWGADRGWGAVQVLEPGASRWHSWKFDQPNEYNAPTPMVRFDSDFSGNNVSWLEYQLEANSAPAQGTQYGRPYKFVVDGSRRYCDLVTGR